MNNNVSAQERAISTLAQQDQESNNTGCNTSIVAHLDTISQNENRLSPGNLQVTGDSQIDSAIAKLRALGLVPTPIKKGNKYPYICDTAKNTYQGLHNADPSVDRLKTWFGAKEASGLGVLCREIDGIRYTWIDFDLANYYPGGKKAWVEAGRPLDFDGADQCEQDALETVAKIKEVAGCDPWVERSGANGWHIAIATKDQSKGFLKDGKVRGEILATGNPCVLAPTIHPDTGKPYESIQGGEFPFVESLELIGLEGVKRSGKKDKPVSQPIQPTQKSNFSSSQQSLSDHLFTQVLPRLSFEQQFEGLLEYKFVNDSHVKAFDPIHGSSSGKIGGLYFNLREGKWLFYRSGHDAGGSAADWYASMKIGDWVTTRTTGLFTEAYEHFCDLAGVEPVWKSSTQVKSTPTPELLNHQFDYEAIAAECSRRALKKHYVTSIKAALVGLDDPRKTYLGANFKDYSSDDLFVGTCPCCKSIEGMSVTESDAFDDWIWWCSDCDASGDLIDYHYRLGGGTRKVTQNKNYLETFDRISDLLGLGITSKDIEGDAGEIEKKKIPLIKVVMDKIREVYGDRIQYNNLKDRVFIDGKPVELLKLKKEFLDEHCLSVQNFEEAAVMVAMDNEFNPAQKGLDKLHQEFLESGKDLSVLDSVALNHFGVNTPEYQLYLRKWFIAFVARILNPGCKVDTVLILKGHQGAKKSTWFKALTHSLTGTDAYFCDDMRGMDNKDEILKLHSHVLVEWGELETVRKAEATQIKAFVTQTKDNIRKPYAKESLELERPSLIVGSTNETSFLVDTTGSRRFWVIDGVDSVDMERAIAEFPTLLGAAVEAYKSGEQWWLNEEQETQLQELNKAFESEDAWLSIISDWVSTREVVSVSEILNDCLVIAPQNQGRRESNRVSSIMTQLGWTRRQKSVKGQRGYFWFPPVDARDVEVPSLFENTFHEGDRVGKKSKTGWSGEIRSVIGNYAEVAWSGDHTVTRELLSDLKLLKVA